VAVPQDGRTARGQPIDLAGLTITHSRTDGSKPGAHTIRQGSVAPGQFFTLGNAAPGSVPAYGRTAGRPSASVAIRQPRARRVAKKLRSCRSACL
jgi:hypothetical protein